MGNMIRPLHAAHSTVTKYITSIENNVVLTVRYAKRTKS